MHPLEPIKRQKAPVRVGQMRTGASRSGSLFGYPSRSSAAVLCAFPADGAKSAWQTVGFAAIRSQSQSPESLCSFYPPSVRSVSQYNLTKIWFVIPSTRGVGFLFMKKKGPLRVKEDLSSNKNLNPTEVKQKHIMVRLRSWRCLF